MPDSTDDDYPDPTEVTALRAAPGMPRVVVQQVELRWHDGEGAHLLTAPERALLGSSPSAQVVVADVTASRIHAELETRPDGIWIKDLGSRNGTFVNGVLVREARIPLGGVLRIGSTDIAFDVVSARTAHPVWPASRFGLLIGRSLIMRELFHYLSSVAASEASVLLRGETGTGKEVVARSIHEASARRSGPFVVVDCGAIPENLIESELFGSAKGAYTGAQATRVGAIEAADGGTVFFDEIGELPLAMQPKLLRVVESREVRRLGETAARHVNVRFLSASHRDLRQMVNAGAFREDLYFRLAVLPVNIPPLRDRLEDLPDLIQHFLPAGSPPVPDAVIQQLRERPWLGNVRELRNFAERGVALGMERALSLSVRPEPMRQPSSPVFPGSPRVPSDLAVPRPPSGNAPNASTSTGSAGAPRAAADLPVNIDQSFKAFREQWLDLGEREYVKRLLERHQRKVSSAAEAADLDRTYLYRLIRKHLL